MALALDGQAHLAQVPRVTGSGPPPELVGILLATFPAPLADGFIRDDHAACEQECFDIAVTEAEPVRQPDPMTDDLLGETMVVVAVRCDWRIHVASMPHKGGFQQVDKAPAISGGVRTHCPTLSTATAPAARV